MIADEVDEGRCTRTGTRVISNAHAATSVTLKYTDTDVFGWYKTKRTHLRSSNRKVPAVTWVGGGEDEVGMGTQPMNKPESRRTLA